MDENNETLAGKISSIANVLSGSESLKFELQFEGASIAMLLGGALLVGVMLIYLNKKM